MLHTEIWREETETKSRKTVKNNISKMLQETYLQSLGKKRIVEMDSSPKTLAQYQLMGNILWKSMATSNYLVTNILENIVFCIKQKK